MPIADCPRFDASGGVAKSVAVGGRELEVRAIVWIIIKQMAPFCLQKAYFITSVRHSVGVIFQFVRKWRMQIEFGKRGDDITVAAFPNAQAEVDVVEDSWQIQGI